MLLCQQQCGCLSLSTLLLERLTRGTEAKARVQIFLPLTRNGLLLALQLCVFAVAEAAVVRAVARWARDSAWVRHPTAVPST